MLMKKILTYALAAGLALVACTKNEVKPVDVDHEITFQTVVNKTSTKALVDGAVYPTGTAFGTFAFFYTSSLETTSDRYINNAEVSFTAGEGGNNWTTSPKYYWPKQGKLTFYSYSPYATLNTLVSCDLTNGFKITGYDVAANQTVDVMVADRIDNQTSNTSNANGSGYNGVPTVFRHKLAQVVDFTIKTDKAYSTGSPESPAVGDKFFYLNEITIGNIAYKGSFDGTMQPSSTNIGTWVKTSDRIDTPYEWYKSTNKTETRFATAELTSPKTIANNYLLVLPQEMTEKANDSDPDTNVEYLKLKYTIRTFWGTGASEYSDETVEQTVALKSVSPKWEINKKYTYNITVSLNQIYWAPSVVDWESGSTTGIEF